MQVKVPQIRGIGRFADNAKAIILYFDRPLTDDEVRALDVLSYGGFPSVELAEEELRR